MILKDWQVTPGYKYLSCLQLIVKDKDRKIDLWVNMENKEKGEHFLNPCGLKWWDLSLKLEMILQRKEKNTSKISKRHLIF